MIFKEIRQEYLEDKVNGYYYFQSFLNIRLPQKEIDYILKSPDAFAIMKIIKEVLIPFIKKEIVLSIAIILMIVTCFIIPIDKEDLPGRGN